MSLHILDPEQPVPTLRSAYVCAAIILAGCLVYYVTFIGRPI